MPRSNRRRRDLETRPLSGAGEVRTEQWRGRPWAVRQLSGSTSGRDYLCPGCLHPIAAGTPHVVAWPAEGVGGVQERRHWHSRCWRGRGAAPPGV